MKGSIVEDLVFDFNEETEKEQFAYENVLKIRNLKLK